MLCPTEAMAGVFSLFPTWSLYPSYRTFMALAVVIVAFPLTYTYIHISKFIQYMSSSEKGGNEKGKGKKNI